RLNGLLPAAGAFRAYGHTRTAPGRAPASGALGGPRVTEVVQYSVENGVATITLNRPDKLNALNDDMYAGIKAALDRTDSDDGVRAVIVTGAGRAFCAGADLSGGGGTFAYGGDDPA